MPKQVIAYVDGFALYKGLLQRTYPQFKWLNVYELVRRLYWQYEVTDVYFFTANLKPTTNDPGIGQRQQKYLQALDTVQNVHIVRGTYIFEKHWYPKHPEELDADGRVVTVKVKRPEEKGSDVNLATQLLMDAWAGNADLYAVLTNDSDLAGPVHAVAKTLRREVSLISVAGDKYNKAFRDVGLASVRQVRQGTLRDSQFPEELAPGLRKPRQWP